MARETTTVQCYPSDEKINATIRQYESFGWELIGNQRCQEYEGSYGTVDRYSTFNKLTFSREKNKPWYEEVSRLERECNRLLNKKPVRPPDDSPSKFRYFIAIFLIIAGIPFMAGLVFCIMDFEALFIVEGIIGAIVFAIGVILIVKAKNKKKSNEARYRLYLRYLTDWENGDEKKAMSIMSQAERIVSEE